jgi:hypothetical protein
MMKDRLEDRGWIETEVGQGRVAYPNSGLTLTVGPTPAGRYSNAQITDYDYASMSFRWRPPLKLTVRAWFTPPPDPIPPANFMRPFTEGDLSGDMRQGGINRDDVARDRGSERTRDENGELSGASSIGSGAKMQGVRVVGTAGFGFWNHPFSPDTRRLRLPQAIWFFFGAPPHNLALAHGVPGHGWKAATIDAGRPGALPLAPIAPLAVLGMQIPALYHRLYPFIQRRLAVGEAVLAPTLMGAPHTYTLEWRRAGAAFAVDGTTVLETPFSPRGTCGFIAWIDNQYAIVTPQGRFGWGIIPITGEQSLIIEEVEIEGLN